MNKHLVLIVFVIFFGAILLTGCVEATPQEPGTLVQPNDNKPTETWRSENTPTVSIIDTPTREPTPASTQPEGSTAVIEDTPIQQPVTIQVAEGDGINHELVFAIRNPGRYSGEAGSPAWLGWGAENFTIAPDGSFWIADDPADPDRLLHFSTTGELLSTLSMKIGDQKYYARDLAVDTSGIWVLDYITQPSLVIHISLDGSLLGKYEIPAAFATYIQEGNVSPGLWHIPFVDRGKILLDGPIGVVALTVTDGKPHFEQVNGYPIGGRIFNEVENGILVDDLRVGMKFLQPDHFLNYAWLLGVATDRSFYIRVDEGNNDQGKIEPTDQYVRRYSSSGELLGIALLPVPEIRTSHDWAIAPDGNVYAMLSRADHSVEFLRLQFAMGVAPLLSPYTQIIQSSFTPLLPIGNVPATEEEAARESILSFYAALAERRYEEAAARFGGTYEEYVALDSAISPEQPGMAWELICQMEFCWAVSDILDTRQTSPDTYEFLVGFVTDNGGRFDYSICCGNFQPIPSVRWFIYSVMVQKINNQWMIVGSPQPLP